jgi:hypothetical protein
MEYTIKMVPISRIKADEVEFSEDARKVVQAAVRAAQNANFRRPVLALKTENGLELVAGRLQFIAKKHLGISETTCIVFSEQPPTELVHLFEEFDRKDSCSVIEARCIETLINTYKLRATDIARMLARSKQIVSDTRVINELPKEILDDALIDRSVGKARLIQIARMPGDESAKIACYNQQKELAQNMTKKPKSRDLGDVTAGLQKVRKIISAIEKRAEHENVTASPAELKQLAAEFLLASADITRLMKKYDASYSLKKTLKSILTR